MNIIRTIDRGALKGWVDLGKHPGDDPRVTQYQLAPEMAEALRFLVTVIKRGDAPLTASMEYAHAVKLLARLEGGEK